MDNPYVSPHYAEKYQFFENYLSLDNDDTRFINPQYLNQKIFIKELITNFKKDRFDNIAAGLQLFRTNHDKMGKGCIKKYGISNILGSGGSFMNVKINMLLSTR